MREALTSQGRGSNYSSSNSSSSSNSRRDRSSYPPDRLFLNPVIYFRGTVIGNVQRDCGHGARHEQTHYDYGRRTLTSRGGLGPAPDLGSGTGKACAM